MPFFWTRQAGISLKYLGNAREWDQVAYRGTVEEGKFIAGYYRGGVLKAAAVVGMPQALIALDRLMARGAPPTAAQLSEQAYDLAAAARGV